MFKHVNKYILIGLGTTLIACTSPEINARYKDATTIDNPDIVKYAMKVLGETRPSDIKVIGGHLVSKRHINDLIELASVYSGEPIRHIGESQIKEVAEDVDININNLLEGTEIINLKREVSSLPSWVYGELPKNPDYVYGRGKVVDDNDKDALIKSYNKAELDINPEIRMIGLALVYRYLKGYTDKNIDRIVNSINDNLLYEFRPEYHMEELTTSTGNKKFRYYALIGLRLNAIKGAFINVIVENEESRNHIKDQKDFENLIEEVRNKKSLEG